jgi:NAD(P)-dependent dehydrogenase (short-subunit alcohol dehydrogenase family)
MAVPLDVTDPAAVDDLASRAGARFGRIDVWVNNAAVTAFGSLQAVPMHDHRRVIETNLFGYIHGARAAFQHFLPQRHGVLINVASIDSRLSQPYMSAYVASKHAIRGLGMSLRQELWLEGYRDVHVCTVMPATVDTPLFQHAANYSGRAVDAMPPVYEAQRVAQTILRLVKKPRREVFVGHSGRFFNAQHQIAPTFTERFMAVLSDHFQLSRKKGATPTAGNLFEPIAEGREVSGHWMWENRRLLPGQVVGACVLGASVLAWLLSARGKVTDTKEPVPMSIELAPSRVQLDFTVTQAELLRECLFTQAEQDGGQRNKILSLHEQVLGALSDTKQRRTEAAPV